MAAPANPSADEIRLLILAAQRHGSRMLAGHLRRQSMTAAQLEVLQVLAGHAPLTLAELGRLLVCESGSPSRLVDSLVRRELVTRQPGDQDKRVVLLGLSPAGRRVLADSGGRVADIDDHISDRLTPDEMNHLAQMLRKLLRGTPAEHAINTRYGTSGPGSGHG